MDNTVVDLWQGASEFFNKKTGEALVPDDLVHYDLWLDYKLEDAKGQWMFRTMCNQAGFWEGLPPIRGALSTLSKLKEKYDIYLVTQPMHMLNCYYEKADWVKVHLPFIGMEKLIFTYDKGVLLGDILVDDYLPYLTKFQGKKILFTQPYNRDLPFQGYRACTWKELGEMLNGVL